MSSYREERRRDAELDAEQRRMDKDAAAKRQLETRAAEDQRRRDNRTADKAEQRAEKLQSRRDRRDRRRDRAQTWAKHTTPVNVYRRGTLALVAASALASLPAQIMHFVSISWLLLPLPFALEGAAWVMAAGVAYADEAKLPGWVRWLLRALSMSAAAFAAHINYAYGSLTSSSVGWGLAAVTLGGPLFFEVRQWVSTLSAASSSGAGRVEAKARRKHDRKRGRHHRDVVRVADRLLTAAPFGTLSAEDAFVAAWAIVHGTQTPGMTPELHAQASAARQSLATAFTPAEHTAHGIRARLLEGFTTPPKMRRPVLGTFGSATPVRPRKAGGSSQVENQIPPVAKAGGRRGPKTPQKPPRRVKGDTVPYSQGARIQAAETARLASTQGARIRAVNGTH